MTAAGRGNPGERTRAGALPPLADGFTARPEMASALANALVPGSTVVLEPAQAASVKPVDWLEPCGKTQLAVSFAEWLWQTGKVDVLVWVTATSQAAVLAGYMAAAVMALGADPAGPAEAGAARLVNWLTETGTPWLVVLDDLSPVVDLESLRPRGSAGRLLITTRDPDVAASESGALALPVGAFSPRDALNYMTGRLTVDTDQRLGAIDLVQELEYEPLALAQASAVIASSALSCRDYQDYFARRWEEMAGAADGRPAAAAVAWTFSIEQADRLSPSGAARALLALTSLLDGNGIPAGIFTAPAVARYLGGDGTDPHSEADMVRGALLVLEQVGLLAGRAGTPAVRVNPVVQAAVRAATPSAALGQAARAAADALLEAWPAEEPGAWAAEAYRSCAASLQRTAAQMLWAEGCHPLLLRAGESLDAAHLTGPAVTYWHELAAASEEVLGPDHADTLAAGYRLACAYLAAGEAAEAVPWFHWAFTGRVRALGAEHAASLAAQVDLGRALVAASRISEAVTVLGRAAADYARARGNSHLDTLAAREELAAAEVAGGLFGDAIRLYRQALDDRGQIQGPRHPATIATRQRLADAYLADSRLKHALTEYKRVLTDCELVLGPDDLNTVTAAAKLAAAYHAAGRMASALQFYEQASASYERILGDGHRDTLACHANLANAYYAVGRLTDGLTLLRETAARAERVLPAGDPFLRSVRESLSNIAGE